MGQYGELPGGPDEPLVAFDGSGRGEAGQFGKASVALQNGSEHGYARGRSRSLRRSWFDRDRWQRTAKMRRTCHAPVPRLTESTTVPLAVVRPEGVTGCSR